MALRDANLDAIQAYQDNGDYRSTNDMAKAILFMEAIEQLLGLRAEQGQKGGTTNEQYRYNHTQLMNLHKRVQSWINTERSARRRKTKLDFGCYR